MSFEILNTTVHSFIYALYSDTSEALTPDQVVMGVQWDDNDLLGSGDGNKSKIILWAQ